MPRNHRIRTCHVVYRERAEEKKKKKEEERKNNKKWRTHFVTREIVIIRIVFKFEI